MRAPGAAAAALPRPRRRIAALALALLVGAKAAAAGEAAPTVPLETLAAALTVWAADALGVPPPASPPAIAFTDRRRMARMLRPDAAPASAAAAADDVEALYDPAARVVHLPPDWRGASAAEVSVLVHELVHHLQTVSGQRFACPQERERDAYALQARWLERFGGSLERDLDLAPIYVLVASHCGP
jgi:hypothetical protein